jgi:uncharacterized protein
MRSSRNSQWKISPRARREGNGSLSSRSSLPFEVRDSPTHGRGAFATRSIRKGARIIEYIGKRMLWSDVPEDDDPHTFLFSIDNGKVINAAIGGNEARWINHSCDPNCEAVGEGERIFVYALRDIEPDEELFYDYALELDEPLTDQLRQDHKCLCATARCRGTMFDIEKA